MGFFSQIRLGHRPLVTGLATHCTVSNTTSKCWGVPATSSNTRRPSRPWWRRLVLQTPPKCSSPTTTEWFTTSMGHPGRGSPPKRYHLPQFSLTFLRYCLLFKSHLSRHFLAIFELPDYWVTCIGKKSFIKKLFMKKNLEFFPKFLAFLLVFFIHFNEWKKLTKI